MVEDADDTTRVSLTLSESRQAFTDKPVPLPLPICGKAIA
jgi:hypothetical protein